MSPEEQAAGSRVTEPKAKAKGRKPKNDKTEKDGDNPKKRGKTGDEKKPKESKKGKGQSKGKGESKPKAKASPKKKAKQPVETKRKRKGGTDQDDEKEGPSAAQLAIRARNSRKSSAYHHAYKKALAAGADVEAAKAEGQAVAKDWISLVFFPP